MRRIGLLWQNLRHGPAGHCRRGFHLVSIWTLPLEYRYFAVDEVTVTIRPQGSIHTGYMASVATLSLLAGL